MHYLTHRCPECGFAALAPVPAIAEGSAGVWQCEGCEQAYDIHVEFRRISPDLLEEKREELRGAAGEFEPDETDHDDDAADRAAAIDAQLADIAGEIHRLRQVIQSLEAEARRLEGQRESL